MRGKKVMVVTLFALLLFGALAFASVSLGQQKVLADYATFNSTASDGELRCWNSSYSVAHDASDASGVQDAITSVIVGQDVFLGLRAIYRSALYFDTSSLPDNAYIISATLSLYGRHNGSQTDFDITIVDGFLLDDPLVAGDYGDLLNQTTSGGVFNTAGFSTSGYNVIPLNSVGMGWISKTGMTKLGLRSSRDINANEPVFTELEYVKFHSNEEGVGYRPKLVVSYYELPSPSAVPTLSQWGMIGMAIVLAAFLIWSIRRRWTVRTGKS